MIRNASQYCKEKNMLSWYTVETMLQRIPFDNTVSTCSDFLYFEKKTFFNYLMFILAL